MLLKLLIGPGPHRLYEFEDVLPRLPLPSLRQTCIKSVTPCLLLRPNTCDCRNIFIRSPFNLILGKALSTILGKQGRISVEVWIQSRKL